MSEQNRNYEQIEEITLHFGKGTMEPFTAKDGREMLKIVIPNADRSDHTPWASFVRFLIHGKLDFGYYLLKIMLPEMIFTTVVTLFIYRLLLAVNNAVRNFSPELPHIFGGFRKNH